MRKRKGSMMNAAGQDVEDHPLVGDTRKFKWYWDAHSVGYPYTDPHMPPMIKATYWTNNADTSSMWGVKSTLSPTAPWANPDKPSDDYWHEMWLSFWIPTSGVVNAQDFGRWGRRPDLTQNTKPTFFGEVTMNLQIGMQWFEIPHLWIQHDVNGYVRLTSNCGDYGYIQTWWPDQHIEVYGYLYGDRKHPYMLSIYTANGTENKNVLTGAKVLYEIKTDVKDSPEAWYAEFNWRLAAHRDETASPVAPDGKWGWTWDPNLYLKDPYGSRTFDKNCTVVAVINDRMTQFSSDAVAAFPKSIKIQPTDTEYTNVTSMQNGLDVVVPIKTADFTHAVADTTTYSFAFNQKLTTKWTWKAKYKGDVDLFFFTLEMDIEIGLEIGLELSWTETWTWTRTDTKTWSALGQTIPLPPKSAATLETVVQRCKASGEIGLLVEIPTHPAVVVASFAPGQEQVSWLEPTLDLVKVAKDLGMTSLMIDPTITDYNKQTNSYKGIYWSPTMTFRTDNAVAGSYKVSPAPFTPPTGELKTVTSIG